MLVFYINNEWSVWSWLWLCHTNVGLDKSVTKFLVFPHRLQWIIRIRIKYFFLLCSSFNTWYNGCLKLVQFLYFTATCQCQGHHCLKWVHFELTTQCVSHESERGSHSKQAVSSLQPAVFLSSASFYDLSDINAVVSGDMLVADPSSDAESKPWLNNTHSEIANICTQTQLQLYAYVLVSFFCMLYFRAFKV